MSGARHSAPPPAQRKTVVAVDLGAESCRISLLRWNHNQPEMIPVHRFPNGPVSSGDALHWDLDAICAGVEEGLRRCAAALAPQGIDSIDSIDSIAVDGWAVDYVRVGADGKAAAPPFCYRDPRTVAAAREAHERISVRRLYELTGVQHQRFNTVYQLYADHLSGNASPSPWINLPEYVLHRLGARRVSEYTNATHTGLIDLHTRTWSEEIFAALSLDISAAPELVSPGSIIGKLSGPLASLPAFRDTSLIAPACHDTASAIAGIPSDSGDWAYISSGTWSLVGTVLSAPRASESAFRHNFTNLGAATGGVCFHTSVNGMWLMQQCMNHWREQGGTPEIDEIIAEAESLDAPEALLGSGALLNMDDPELLLPGNMPARINHQRQRSGLPLIPESAAAAPAFANLIFHSLAARYARALSDLSDVTGGQFRKVVIVGGGSRNRLLNRLTEQATGLPVSIGHAESSTLGNFALQLAALNWKENSALPDSAEVGFWTRILKDI